MRLAELAVATNGVLVTTGLGSCVAIVLHDADARVGALAHVLLPDPSASREKANPARFAETAVPAMIAGMVARGASPARIRARIAGGATMFANLLTTTGENMGERNLRATRAALELARVPLVGEDTGGDHGRTVRLRVADGVVEVRSLRAGVHEL